MTTELKLTSTQAMGIALSVVMKLSTLESCILKAEDIERHLRQMGFHLRNIHEEDENDN